MLATLRQRNFALLWFGGLISLTGDWILYTALPFYVYQRTHSTLATAAMVAAELVPNFLFGSVAGVFVDRWDRKRVMVITNLLQTVVVLLLLLVQSNDWLWIVYLVSFVQTSIGTFFGPAETALLPQLVGEEQLLTANSLNALNNNLARLIGPPIGGAMLSFFDLSGVVVLDSLSFLLAGVLIALIAAPRSRVEPEPHAADIVNTSLSRFGKEWMEGLRLVWGDRVVMALFVVLVLTSFGGIMFDPLYPPFVQDVLHVDSQGFGWLLTAQATGGIIGGLVLGRFAKTLSPIYLLGWGSVVAGGMLLVHFSIPSFPLGLAIKFLVGVPTVAAGAAAQTLVQRSIPDSHLGRVLGALGTTTAVLSLVSVLGLAGALGELLGIVPMLDVATGITIFAGVLALVLLPRAARRGRSSDAADQETPAVS